MSGFALREVKNFPDSDLAMVPWPDVGDSGYELHKYYGTIHLLSFVLTKCFPDVFDPSRHNSEL